VIGVRKREREERGEGEEKESLYLDEVGDGTTMRSLRSDGDGFLLAFLT